MTWQRWVRTVEIEPRLNAGEPGLVNVTVSLRAGNVVDRVALNPVGRLIFRRAIGHDETLAPSITHRGRQAPKD